MSNDESKRVSVMEDDDVLVEHDSIASTDNGGDLVLAKDETKMIFRFRIILLLVLLTTAVIVSVTAYILSANAEADDFEVNFDSQATRVRCVNRTMSVIVLISTHHGLISHCLPSR